MILCQDPRLEKRVQFWQHGEGKLKVLVEEAVLRTQRIDVGEVSQKHQTSKSNYRTRLCVVLALEHPLGWNASRIPEDPVVYGLGR